MKKARLQIILRTEPTKKYFSRKTKFSNRPVGLIRAL